MNELVLFARPDYAAPGLLIFLAFFVLWTTDRQQRFALYFGLSFAISALTFLFIPMALPLDSPVPSSLRPVGGGVIAALILLVVGAAHLSGWSRRLTACVCAGLAAIPALGVIGVLQISIIRLIDLATFPGHLLAAAALWSRGGRMLRLASVLVALRGLNFSAFVTLIPDYTYLDRAALNQVFAYAAGVVLLCAGFIRVMEQLAVQRDQLQQEVQRRTATLQASRARLQEANRDLEQLSAVLTGTLEVPLQRMQEITAELGDSALELDAAGRGYVGRMQAAAERMQQIVRSLFDLHLVAARQLDRQSLDLGALARECFDQLVARNPGPVPSLEIETDLHARADRSLLASVLENLLDNAWKYSARNAAPRIVFGRSTDAQDGFVVRDNGVGFDPSEAGKLFEPFQRLHDERDFEGTGVGLATVRRIIARHGGRIWAEGRPGEGAAFHFTLGKG